MRNNPFLRALSLVWLCALPFPVNAANGTWTKPGSGSWTNAANWSGAVIADGAGNTANFSAATMNLSVNSSGTAFAVTGPGTLRLVGTTNSSTVPDIYFGPNHSANSYWGARIATSLDLGNAQRYIFGKTGHNGIGQYGLTN